MDAEFKVNNFDLIRIFAATQVLIMHSAYHLHINSSYWGDLLLRFPGVAMFFVTSGFLISASLERNNDLKNYFKNRALRIYPALWVCLIVSIIVIYLVAKIDFFNWQTPVWIISQSVGIIYTPHFLKNFGFGSYNGSLWTIPIELQFYIVLPITYAIISGFIKKEATKTFVLSGIFIAFFIISYYISVYYTNTNLLLETKGEKIVRYTFTAHIYMFFWGVILQRTKAYKSNLVNGKGLIFIAVYLIFSYVVPDNDFTGMLKMLLLGVTTISMAYTFTGAAQKILKGTDISYGVYIYHGLIIGVLVQLKYFGSFNYIIIVFVGAYLTAFLSWTFVEKPILRRKRITIKKVA